MSAPRDEGLRVGALVFKVADLTATRSLLQANGISVHEHRGKLVVAGEAARLEDFAKFIEAPAAAIGSVQLDKVFAHAMPPFPTVASPTLKRLQELSPSLP